MTGEEKTRHCGAASSKRNNLSLILSHREAAFKPTWQSQSQLTRHSVWILYPRANFLFQLHIQRNYSYCDIAGAVCETKFTYRTKL